MIDLHTHTTYSDGSYSAPELLKLAQEKKLSLIFITDHNTINAHLMLRDNSIRKYLMGKF